MERSYKKHPTTKSTDARATHSNYRHQKLCQTAPTRFRHRRAERFIHRIHRKPTSVIHLFTFKDPLIPKCGEILSARSHGAVIETSKLTSRLGVLRRGRVEMTLVVAVKLGFAKK